MEETFGAAIKRLRVSKSLTQEEIASRLEGIYSDASSYRRIENGKRQPDPDSALAILTLGLQLTDSKQINQLLRLAGYEGLSTAEVKSASQQQSTPATTTVSELASLPAFRAENTRTSLRKSFSMIALASAACSVVVVLTALAKVDTWFSLASIVFYTTLYILSILLETAYLPEKTGVVQAIAGASGLIGVSSALGLCLDGRMIRSGSRNGLWLTLTVFFVGAVAQWFIARGALPDRCLVGTHTAQAAHAKNTGYFLIAVLFFWIPPTHCMALLRGLGGSQTVIPSPNLWLMNARGILCLGPGSLLFFLLFLIGFSVAMRGALLDRLRPSPYRNRYILLFYLRAGVFFGFCFFCVGWLNDSLSSFRGL